MLGKNKTYYIQSGKHTGTLYHHAMFADLKKILMSGSLISPKPWRPISVTTAPGRYLSPIPQFAGISCVDGYVEFVPQEDDGWIPAIYKTTDPDMLGIAKATGRAIYTEIPSEYKHIQQFAIKRDLFITEDEWLLLAPRYNVWDGKIHISSKHHKRFCKGLTPYYAERVVYHEGKKAKGV